MRKDLANIFLLALFLLLGACNDQVAEEIETPEAELWVQEHPDSQYAWNVAAVYRLNTRNYKGAVEAFEKLIELNPDEPHNYALMAMACTHTGEKSRAKELINRAVAVAKRVNDSGLEGIIQWKESMEKSGFEPNLTLKVTPGTLRGPAAP